MMTGEEKVEKVIENILRNLKKKIPEANVIKTSINGVRVKYKNKIFDIGKLYGIKGYFVDYNHEKLTNQKEKLEMDKLSDDIRGFLIGPTRQDAIRISKKIRKTAIKLPKRILKLENVLSETTNEVIIKLKSIGNVSNIKVVPVDWWPKMKNVEFKWKSWNFYAISNKNKIDLYELETVPKNERENLFNLLNTKGIEDVKKITKDIRKTATKLPKKKLSLKESVKDLSNMNAKEAYKAGIYWKEFDFKRGFEELIKKDKDGLYIYLAGIYWKEFDFKKGFDELIKKDKDGNYIYWAGKDWKEFDFKRGLEELIKKDKDAKYVYLAGTDWKDFNYKKGLEMLKNTKWYKEAMKHWPKNIEAVKDITKKIRQSSTKLPKKTLKLEGTQMKKFTNLIKLLKKAILHKRKARMVEDIYKHIYEEEKIVVPRRHNAVTTEDKRKKLKDIYKRILKGTPYADNIPVFLELIDQVPEDYLNYELDIDFNDTFKVVDELISGKGDLTTNEMGELANIISGIGIPAIEKHATGKNKMSKKDAEFGAKELSKSAKRFNQSVKGRRDPKGKLEAPKSTAVIPVESSKELATRKALARRFTDIAIPKDSPFWNTASKLKSKGIDINRLAKSMTKASKYSEAKKQAEMELKKQGKSIEYLRGTDDIFNIWNQIKKQKIREKVRVK